MAEFFRQFGDYFVFVLLVLAVSGGVAFWLWRKRERVGLPRAFWLALIAFLLAGSFYVDSAGRRPQQRLITLFEGIAPTYADELERLGHADLVIETAAKDPRYLLMIDALRRWVRLNPLVSDIYTFRRLEDGRIVLLVDAETDYDEDGLYVGEHEMRTQPGEVYEQAGPELRAAFAGESNFMTRPVTDRWGTWVSVHVPMFDSSGRVEAVLGMDYRADLWMREIVQRRRVALVYLGVVFFILIGSGTSIAVYRSELTARNEAEARLRASLLEVERENAERRAAELARRASDARLELHVQQMPQAYVEWGPDFRVIRWNPAAERIFGFTAQEAIGRSFDDLIVPDRARADIAALGERLKTDREPIHHSNENLTKDGRIIFCEWHNTPLVDGHGALLAVASHAQEITERVRIEQHLRQAQKLESMGQLAGGVAHEFNNLLTPMLMQMGQIQTAYAHDVRLLEFLRPVEDSIMQAAQLNQRILAVGRRQSDAHALGDLNQMVGTAVDLLRHTLDRRIELTLDLMPDLPPTLLSRGAIVQVVMNLALNARDTLLSRLEAGRLPGWTPRLTISTRRAAQLPEDAPESLRAARECLRLSIADNGEGMSAELQSRVFEPFFTTKPAGKGTGLGLAVVWSVVESLGGHIELNSTPGAGSEFSLYLAVAGREDVPLLQAEPAVAKPAAPGKHALRVLLVDDNALVRETFGEALRRAGHLVDEASDGEAGLHALQADGFRRYDLLIADLNLPRLSGRELLQGIRTGGYVGGILVVSGLPEPRLFTEMRAFGVDMVLRKPIGMSELLAAVQEAASRAATRASG